MQRISIPLLSFGLMLASPAVLAGSVPPTDAAKINGMTGEQLMEATTTFDAQMASDLAR